MTIIKDRFLNTRRIRNVPRALKPTPVIIHCSLQVLRSCSAVTLRITEGAFHGLLMCRQCVSGVVRGLSYRNSTVAYGERANT
ncbi:hypothetical protein YC2023_079843 [Brassica napus]